MKDFNECSPDKLGHRPHCARGPRVIWKRSFIHVIERFSFECRKVIGFALTTLRDWFKKLAPLFHPIRSKTKTNQDSLVRVFPPFAPATCNYLVPVLIGSFDHLCTLWLARVITLVLVLRHSIENRSIYGLALPYPLIQNALQTGAIWKCRFHFSCGRKTFCKRSGLKTMTSRLSCDFLPGDWCVLNSPKVVWTEDIWCVLRAKPPFSNSSDVMWTGPYWTSQVTCCNRTVSWLASSYPAKTTD